jgi:hypothetical protein
MKKISLNSLSEIKRAFKTEDSRFIVGVGLKVSGISLAISGFVYWFLFQILQLNLAFFKSQGFPTLGDRGPFFDMVILEAVENLPLFLGFHICLFFIGAYVGWLILRPFRTIGEYCEEVIGNPNAIYRIEQFSTYSLLIRFAEFFFEYLRESRKRHQIISNSIPPQFSKIHRPVFDKIFMLHFGLLLVIISISSAVFIIENSSMVYESMVELSRKLPNQKIVSQFYIEQLYILDEIVYLTVFCITVSYIMLGLHLYGKVSGAAFGIFSTMRSFMKGNYSSRVHLLGHGYLRDYTRRINKYLDFIENNLAK